LEKAEDLIKYITIKPWKGGLENMLISRKVGNDWIIKAIYSDIAIGSTLGFKGGTALYLYYNLPRFSIDLVLIYLMNQKDLVFKKLPVLINMVS
jgi:predicted nucleotidyltransferase component of viral defense system